MDSPLLRDATLANIVAGVIAAIVGLLFSRLLMWTVFALASRSTDLLRRATEQSLAANGQPLTLEQRKAAIELISATLEQPRKKLRSYNSAAEVVSGLAFLFFALSFWGNVLDLSIAVFLALIAIVITIRSTQFFLSDYFGPAMVKAELEGRRPPSSADF